METIPVKIPDITTARLRLVAMTPEMLDADAIDARRLEPMLHARVPAEWPDENWEAHVFDFLRRQLAEHPETAGWVRYVVLAGGDAVLIGTVCAFPRSEKEAEFGYAILGPWQRRGLATEAARALVEEVFRLEGVTDLVGHTFPHLVGSIRVMERCGMVADGVGEEAGTVRYRLRRVGGVAGG
jgi:ribosomal-protein-alanine N-acetyltransferase